MDTMHVDDEGLGRFAWNRQWRGSVLLLMWRTVHVTRFERRRRLGLIIIQIWLWAGADAAREKDLLQAKCHHIARAPTGPHRTSSLDLAPGLPWGLRLKQE